MLGRHKFGKVEHGWNGQSGVTRLWTNSVANVVGGALFGYGGCAFLYFLGMTEYWHAAAPHVPQPGLGLIYSHNEHGDYRYFSAFQIMAVGLPFLLSVPLGMLGMVLAPKKNRVGLRWEQDDPRHLFKWTAILSALATPFLLSTVGAVGLQKVISAGFVLSLY